MGPPRPGPLLNRPLGDNYSQRGKPSQANRGPKNQGRSLLRTSVAAFAAAISLGLWSEASNTIVPVGNLRSEILVVQSIQSWHRQRATDSLDGTRDRRVLVQR